MLTAILIVLRSYWAEPPIVVARDTTYITEPLRPNGLPDYEKYFLEQSRKGTTPDNNAGVLLWQTLWPNDLHPQDYEPMRAELGLKEIPPASAALQLVYGDANKKRVLSWLRKQHREVDEIDPYDWIGPATDSAWTSQQFPPLAEWVESNRRPLDLIVAASRRPRFYFPSPSMLEKRHYTLITAMLPGVQIIQEAARGLSTRAMWHIGEYRLSDAWSDLLAIHRLARLMSQAQTSIEQVVAMRLSYDACQDTLVLLGNEHLTAELARQINKDLAGLPEFHGVIHSFDSWERLSALDIVILDLKTNGIGGVWDNPPSGPHVFKLMAFDLNVTLRRVNYWFDRLVATTKLPTREARKRAYARFAADFSLDGERINQPIPLIVALFSLEKRSRMLGDKVAGIMMLTLDSADFEERSNTTLQLTRLAAALTVYRAERGRYPAKLDELIPGALEKLPVDIYNANPFLYQRLDGGYLLYSAGENGVDDGGSHRDWDIFKGQSLAELKNSDPKKTPPQIPAGADDISIRIPRPLFKLPQLGGPARKL